MIVDAVGVCERDKTVSPSLERQPSVSTRTLLQKAAMGIGHADLVSTLASRLARLGRRGGRGAGGSNREGGRGKSLAALTGALLDSIDPQATHEAAAVRHGLPDDERRVKRKWTPWNASA